MDYIKVSSKEVKEINEMEFTREGYVVCNGLYIGLVEDGWQWYVDYEECKANTIPVVNFAEIQSIKEYVDNY